MTTTTRLNLPADQAIERIKREARGRRICLHAGFTGVPAAPTDPYERVRFGAVVRVSMRDLERFLLSLPNLTDEPFLVPVAIADGYVWVG